MASNSERHPLECMQQCKMHPTSPSQCWRVVERNAAGKRIKPLLVLFVAGFFFCCHNLIPPVSPTTHECGSIDIRNNCSSFQYLENCTVIKGYLMIVHVPKDAGHANSSGEETCEYENITFPLLREITDFIIMYQVKGLKSIRKMFPNLTVIRGQRLYLNYAIGLSEMADLETIEFKSLVAIQRGHVFIGLSPKLCQLEKINWDRLTLSTGQNHIFPMAPERCTEKSNCSGCRNDYCWSSHVCQKFENDNVINPSQNTKHCHEQCLGGCHNASNAGCTVCRGLTDHGVCVAECPSDKYLHEHSQRCYTHDECIHGMGLLAYDGSCLPHCPSGFKSDENGSCMECASNEACVRICQPERYEEDPVMIYTLSDGDKLSGCEAINGTLIVTIRNKINEHDLEKKLSSLREISGYLKISRSPHLTSLKFLKNLRKVGGVPTDYGDYSLIVYNNKNLKELWQPHHFELERGGMYIHMNNRLCNQNLMEFREKVEHNFDADSLQTSDQETLCDPFKLLLDVQVLSHRELLFSWRKEQTAEEIEILFRPISATEEFTYESDLDTNVCDRINWHRELIFIDDLNDNITHYSYLVSGLSPNTKYACMVKTFGPHRKRNARSDLLFITTNPDVPPPPTIKIIEKTDSSITFDLDVRSSPQIDYYLLEVYKKPDDVHYLDKRNYCIQQAYLTRNRLTEAFSNSIFDEDYDDCCARVEEDNEDERFRSNMRSEFSCSLDRKEYCLAESASNDTGSPDFDLRLNGNESRYELHHLERFHLYVIMVKACNEVGCSSFGMRSERTNYTAEGDLVGDLEACRVSNSTEYRVYFTEPPQPNGAIVSYVVHFRLNVPDVEHFHSKIGCVTRLEHQKSNNVFVRHIKSSFNQVAVRAHSLAGDVITPWVNVTQCNGLRSAPKKMTNLNRINPSVKFHSGHGVNLFLLFFILGGVGTLLWVFYKQRYWRRIPELRRFLPISRARGIVHSLVSRYEGPIPEDRQILVDNFESVRFQNLQDDENRNDAIYSRLSN